MDPFTRLYLIRHGEVATRYHRVFGGRIDMELSPQGHEQVQALADYFQHHPPDSIYASPMQRAQQTLAPLAEQSKKTPMALTGLREVDFGDWTGLSWDQVMERYQISAFHWLEQLDTGGIAGAESTAHFRERIEFCLRQILLESPHKSVAVVCHGGVIRMALAILLDIPFRRMNAFDIEYASVTKVLVRPARVEVELLNFAPWRDLPRAAAPKAP